MKLTTVGVGFGKAGVFGAWRGRARRIGELDQNILAYDRQLEALARTREAAKRLQHIPAIGPITATALVARVADAKLFDNGRQHSEGDLQAWRRI
jgi:transposase